MYRDPENSRNAGTFLAGREELGSHLAAQLRAVRAAAPPKPPAAPATPTARSRSCASSNRELVACGRRPLLRRVHATLRLLGESVRPHSGSALPPLTAAQVEVLDLVGRGLDTRAIARRLVVSEATVETHVRQSMQRLGVSTRLAAAVELVRRRGDCHTGRTARSAHRGGLGRTVRLPEDRDRRRAPAARTVDAQSHDVREPGGSQQRRRRAPRSSPRPAAPRSRSGSRRRCPRTARAELLDALARIGPVENLGTATVAREIETDEVMRDALRGPREGWHGRRRRVRGAHVGTDVAPPPLDAAHAARRPQQHGRGARGPRLRRLTRRRRAGPRARGSGRLEHHHVDRPIRDPRLVRGIPRVDLASRAQDRLALRPGGHLACGHGDGLRRGTGPRRRDACGGCSTSSVSWAARSSCRSSASPSPAGTASNADVRFAPDLAPVEVTKTIGNPATNSGIVRPFPYFAMTLSP